MPQITPKQLAAKLACDDEDAFFGRLIKVHYEQPFMLRYVMSAIWAKAVRTYPSDQAAPWVRTRLLNAYRSAERVRDVADALDDDALALAKEQLSRDAFVPGAKRFIVDFYWSCEHSDSTIEQLYGMMERGVFEFWRPLGAKNQPRAQTQAALQVRTWIIRALLKMPWPIGETK